MYELESIWRLFNDFTVVYRLIMDSDMNSYCGYNQLNADNTIVTSI